MKYGFALIVGRHVMVKSAPVGQIVRDMGNTLMMNSMPLGTIRMILKMTELNASGEDENA